MSKLGDFRMLGAYPCNLAARKPGFTLGIQLTGTASIHGSHLAPGCKIYTTAEIVIARFEDMIYKRELVEDPGYEKLVVLPQLLMAVARVSKIRMAAFSCASIIDWRQQPFQMALNFVFTTLLNQCKGANDRRANHKVGIVQALANP